MLIYRFENEAGMGCFWTGCAYRYNEATTLEDDCYDPPGPFSECASTELHKHHRDKGLKGLLFGFSSKASLRRWFTCAKGRRAMTECRLVVYEVPSEAVLRGNWQVVFNPKQATLVDVLDKGTLKSIAGDNHAV